jgi:hypothetical protein
MAPPNHNTGHFGVHENKTMNITVKALANFLGLAFLASTALALDGTSLGTNQSGRVLLVPAAGP